MAFRKRSEPANDGTPPQEGLDRFYLLIMDNHEGKTKPYQDPKIFTKMKLSWSGGWKIGFSDLSIDQQEALVACGAVVLPGDGQAPTEAPGPQKQGH